MSLSETNSFVSPYDRKPPQDTKVLMAMSGGVDSSVGAALLKSQGYQVIGVHLQLWDHGDANQDRFGSRCCSLIDSNDARRVCDRLDIPFYVINAQDVFKEKVVDYFIHEYMQTRTPNPCVQCNNSVKFDYLYDRARELDCDFVATGHYAQVRFDPKTGEAQLHRAIDPKKDQSYFLFGMTQEALQKTMMPIGGLSKEHVRKLGIQFELNNISDKPDSQEICFIGQEGYQDFIERRTTPELIRNGPVRNTKGASVGTHQGLFRYTVGQRKGLNLSQKDDKEPYYVVGFDTNTDALIVGREDELFQNRVIATRVNWLSHQDRLKPFNASAKIRAHHEAAACQITVFENDTVYVEFEEKQRAITPGQTIVFYHGEQVIGGGFIEKAGSEVNAVDKTFEDLPPEDARM